MSGFTNYMVLLLLPIVCGMENTLTPAGYTDNGEIPGGVAGGSSASAAESKVFSIPLNAKSVAEPATLKKEKPLRSNVVVSCLFKSLIILIHFKQVGQFNIRMFIFEPTKREIILE